MPSRGTVAHAQQNVEAATKPRGHWTYDNVLTNQVGVGDRVKDPTTQCNYAEGFSPQAPGPSSEHLTYPPK